MLWLDIAIACPAKLGASNAVGLRLIAFDASDSSVHGGQDENCTWFIRH